VHRERLVAAGLAAGEERAVELPARSRGHGRRRVAGGLHRVHHGRVHTHRQVHAPRRDRRGARHAEELSRVHVELDPEELLRQRVAQVGDAVAVAVHHLELEAQRRHAPARERELGVVDARLPGRQRDRVDHDVGNPHLREKRLARDDVVGRRPRAPRVDRLHDQTVLQRRQVHAVDERHEERVEVLLRRERVLAPLELRAEGRIDEPLVGSLVDGMLERRDVLAGIVLGHGHRGEVVGELDRQRRAERRVAPRQAQ
jgi:hypothetical protein